MPKQLPLHAAQCVAGACIAVAQADANAQLDSTPNYLVRTGKLRGNGHQANVPFGCLPQAVEQFDCGQLQIAISVRTSFCVRDEWAFEMNSEGPRAAKVGTD